MVADEYVQKYHAQCTCEHGEGSLMFWGWMKWNGVGQACKIDIILDSTLNCEILDDSLVWSTLENTAKWRAISLCLNKIMIPNTCHDEHMSGSIKME